MPGEALGLRSPCFQWVRGRKSPTCPYGDPELTGDQDTHPWQGHHQQVTNDRVPRSPHLQPLPGLQPRPPDRSPATSRPHGTVALGTGACPQWGARPQQAEGPPRWAWAVGSRWEPPGGSTEGLGAPEEGGACRGATTGSAHPRAGLKLATKDMGTGPACQSEAAALGDPPLLPNGNALMPGMEVHSEEKTPGSDLVRWLPRKPVPSRGLWSTREVPHALPSATRRARTALSAEPFPHQ